MKQTIKAHLETISECHLLYLIEEYLKNKYPDKDLGIEIETTAFDSLNDYTRYEVNAFVSENRLETDQEYSWRLQKEKEKEERERKAKIILAEMAADSLKAQYEKKLEELERLKSDEATATQ